MKKDKKIKYKKPILKIIKPKDINFQLVNLRMVGWNQTTGSDPCSMPSG